jgi:hypothetical protein
MTTPDAPLVLRHDDDRGVCTLTLNRPAAFNALSEEMLTALQSELDNLLLQRLAKLFVRGMTFDKCALSPLWITTKSSSRNAVE